MIWLTRIHTDERESSAMQFPPDTVTYYASLGVTIKRLITDIGSAFRSRDFCALCAECGIKQLDQRQG